MFSRLMQKIQWWFDGLCTNCGDEPDSEAHGYQSKHRHCYGCGKCTLEGCSGNLK